MQILPGGDAPGDISSSISISPTISPTISGVTTHTAASDSAVLEDDWGDDDVEF